MKKFRILSTALAGLVIGTVGVVAQQNHNHAGHGAGAAHSASSAEYTKAMEIMHRDMDIEYSGNADADFVRGMIPHHEGAVAMAKIVLKYGKDPEIRKLAEAVVKAQEAEIAMMKKWLEKNK